MQLVQSVSPIISNANTKNIAQARAKFSNIVADVQYHGDTYLISRHGKAVAAVVPIKIYENYQQKRQQFFEQISALQNTASLSAQKAKKIAKQAISFVRSQKAT